MNYSEVKDLLNAGFTADEIRSMINPQNPQNNPQPEPQPDPEPTPLPDPENPQPDSKPEPQPDPIAELKELFQGLKQSNENLARVIQASNVQNASFGSNSVDDINKKAEDALRSLIRPDLEKEGK